MTEADKELEEREQSLTDTIKQRGACREVVEQSTFAISLRQYLFKRQEQHYTARYFQFLSFFLFWKYLYMKIPFISLHSPTLCDLFEPRSANWKALT